MEKSPLSNDNDFQNKNVKIKVLKRGRKWLTCRIGKNVAKVLINDASNDLHVNDIAKVDVIDKSQTNKFGTNIIFEPFRVCEKLDTEREEALKWLYLAEKDLAARMCRTNAVRRVLEYEDKYSDLKDRFDEIHDAIEHCEELERIRIEEESQYNLVESEPPETPYVRITNGGASQNSTRIYRLYISSHGNRLEEEHAPMIRDDRSHSRRSGGYLYRMPTEDGVYKVTESYKGQYSEWYMCLSFGTWYLIEPSNSKTARSCLININEKS